MVINSYIVILAPLILKIRAAAMDYSQKIWLLSYNAQLSLAMHCNSKVKKNIFIYIYIFFFYFVFTLIRIF